MNVEKFGNTARFQGSFISQMWDYNECDDCNVRIVIRFLDTSYDCNFYKISRGILLLITEIMIDNDT